MYRQQAASNQRLMWGQEMSEWRGVCVKMIIKTTKIVEPRDQIMLNHTCPRGMHLEPPRGHKWTFTASRGRVVICADATVRRQVEDRILVTTVVALPTGPALVHLVAGTFNW